jgi:hypothetical protein
VNVQGNLKTGRFIRWIITPDAKGIPGISKRETGQACRKISPFQWTVAVTAKKKSPFQETL